MKIIIQKGHYEILEVLFYAFIVENFHIHVNENFHI
nr:MAG TPA: hypothetical protein [Caudoviricetes sp.]